MLNPNAAAGVKKGTALGTPDWLLRADKPANLSAQPGAPGDAPRADKCENPVSALHSAEGPCETLDAPLCEAPAGEPQAIAPSPPEQPTPEPPPPAEQLLPAEKTGAGRPKEFGAFAKAQVCGLIGAGISQRQASVYLGFHPSMVSTELRRDKQFAADVARAMVAARFQPLYKVIKASERSWRAAVWLLNHAQPHTDLTDREARRAARKAEAEAQKQAEREKELRRQRQLDGIDEFNAICARLR